MTASEAMEGAHVIYAKSWSSTTVITATSWATRSCANNTSWTGVSTSPGSTNAREDCRFMHCLPVRRGVVVSEPVLDGPRSVVIPEARNRMLAQMAVLHQMLGGSS